MAWPLWPARGFGSAYCLCNGQILFCRQPAALAKFSDEIFAKYPDVDEVRGVAEA